MRYRFLKEIGMRKLYLVSIVVMLYLGVGCAVQSGVLLDRKTKGMIVVEEKKKKYVFHIDIEPETLSQVKEGIKIQVKYATQEYLDDYFKDKVIAGIKTGENPYPFGSVVFYTFIQNTNKTKIGLHPNDFVLLDDLGNQYSLISPEYIIALQSSKLSLHSVSKAAEESTPGVYGAPIKVVADLTSRPLKRKLSVLRQVSLSEGYIYGGVSYEGYIVFPRPYKDAKRLTLLMPGVKMQFATDDRAVRSTDFIFEFQIKTQ